MLKAIKYDITDILVNKGLYVEVKNIGNNTETSAQNIVVNENLDSNDFLKTSSANNIIVIDGDISGGAKIEPMESNDFIAILGDLINDTDKKRIKTNFKKLNFIFVNNLSEAIKVFGGK